MKDLIFTDGASEKWFYKKYYASGGNSRYFTFQLALNLLKQLRENPVIVETGCQRMPDDLGAGMSTSIFGEFCQKYGGHLYTVDLIPQNLSICKNCTARWSNRITYIQSDSIAWLDKGSVQADLLYLDSLDYDYGGLLNIYGGRTDIQKAMKIVNDLGDAEVLKRHSNIILPAQEHCLNELRTAIRAGVIKENTILMIDDNQLPGGGKSRLAKEYLTDAHWICLLDFQQTVWVRNL